MRAVWCCWGLFGLVLAVHLGEPYGMLILTASIVSVEVVILVVMLMGNQSQTLARNSVFANFVAMTVMGIS